MNVNNPRSPNNIDPLCVFKASEKYHNLKVACGEFQQYKSKDLFKEIMEAQHNTLEVGDREHEVVQFESNDHKMTSVLAGHNGQSCEFFQVYYLATLKDLVPRGIPGGTILYKYHHVAPLDCQYAFPPQCFPAEVLSIGYGLL